MEKWKYEGFIFDMLPITKYKKNAGVLTCVN